MQKDGVCYLIGAGPGDPGLVTLRGAECLHEADVIYYDYLAAPELLKHAKDEAEIIYVGKSAGKHTLSQEEITKAVVTSVKNGKIVARLKGGDPFIFGRGGEEATALAEAGLSFEIIPGVTAAVAASAYAGIPLTHRGISTSVTFVTGHETPEKGVVQTNWQALANSGDTICIYMGVANIGTIASKLIEYGRADSEPVAVIRRGTTSEHITLTGNLGNIAEKIEQAGLRPPAMIVIGRVVDLRKQIGWFEDKPLLGKRVVVTRTREQASKLVDELRSMGAVTLEIPAIRIVPVLRDFPEGIEQVFKSAEFKRISELSELEKILAECDTLTRGVGCLCSSVYDYVSFTSVNGVQQVWQKLLDLGFDARVFAGKTISAIGPGTASALEEIGVVADFVPATYTGEGVLEEYLQRDIKGKGILLLRASNARKMLAEKLSEAGAIVSDVAVYEVEECAPSEEDRKILESGDYDAACFASSQTVRNFVSLSGAGFSDILKRDNPPVFASIGPVTTKTMQELDLAIASEAAEATIPALAVAIKDALLKGTEK